MTTFEKTSGNLVDSLEVRTVRVLDRDVSVAVFHADDEGLEIVNGKKGKDVFGHLRHDITLRGNRESFSNFEKKVKGVKYTK